MKKKGFWRRFIEIWQGSNCLTEVAVKLTRHFGLTVEPEEAVRLAFELRKKGIALKQIQQSNLPPMTWPAYTTPEFNWQSHEPGLTEQMVMWFRGTRPGQVLPPEAIGPGLLFD